MAMIAFWYIAADGCTFHAKEGVLRTFIALGGVSIREPWIQWQAR
jgi:hypothetical protein